MDPIELVAHELKDIKDRLDRLENLAELHTTRFNLAEGMAKENTVRLDRLELVGKLTLDGTKWQEGAEKLDIDNSFCRANPKITCTWPTFRADDCCGQCGVYADEYEKRKEKP